MYFPEFLKKGDCVGVTAPSSGVEGKTLEYEKSIACFKDEGFSILETKDVRGSALVSSDSLTRANELTSLFLDPSIKMINIARGGDFLFDVLPFLDFSLLASHPKWLGGSSDPTSLLYILTTKYDIATIYTPSNMTGFNRDDLAFKYYFEIIKGKLVKEKRFAFCESKPFSDVYDKKNEWINLNGDVSSTGILIGGCIDVLKDLIGTKYDVTRDFISKYKNEGIIWYFDVFGMSVEMLYNTLLQFKYAGWFKYTDTILIGKVCFPSSFNDLSYEEMIKKALGEYKVVFNFDVGHVKPSFTMINGCKVKVVSNKLEGSLEYLSNVI